MHFACSKSDVMIIVVAVVATIESVCIAIRPNVDLLVVTLSISIVISSMLIVVLSIIIDKCNAKFAQNLRPHRLLLHTCYLTHLVIALSAIRLSHSPNFPYFSSRSVLSNVIVVTIIVATLLTLHAGLSISGSFDLQLQCKSTQLMYTVSIMVGQLFVMSTWTALILTRMPLLFVSLTLSLHLSLTALSNWRLMHARPTSFIQTLTSVTCPQSIYRSDLAIVSVEKNVCTEEEGASYQSPEEVRIRLNAQLFHSRILAHWTSLIPIHLTLLVIAVISHQLSFNSGYIPPIVPLLSIPVATLAVECLMLRLISLQGFSHEPNSVNNGQSVKSFAVQIDENQSCVQPSAPPALAIGVGGDDGVAPSDHQPFVPQVRPGIVRCAKNSCITCTRLAEGNIIVSTSTGQQYGLCGSFTCFTSMVVYVVTCLNCQLQYVGKTEQQMRQRHYGHRREIDIKSTPLGNHFTSRNKIVGSQTNACIYEDHFSIQMLQTVSTAKQLAEAEGYWINQLATLAPKGINQRNEAK